MGELTVGGGSLIADNSFQIVSSVGRAKHALIAFDRHMVWPPSVFGDGGRGYGVGRTSQGGMGGHVMTGMSFHPYGCHAIWSGGCGNSVVTSEKNDHSLAA